VGFAAEESASISKNKQRSTDELRRLNAVCLYLIGLSSVWAA
jgi:hypothetical protein